MREIKLPLYILGLSVFILGLAGWIIVDGGMVAAIMGGTIVVGALTSMAGATLEIRNNREGRHPIGRLLSLFGQSVVMLGLAGWIINDGSTVHRVAGAMVAVGALMSMVGAILDFRQRLHQRG